MSAYELADWIESSAYGDYTSAKEAANMLRQQADRIAELEKQCAKYEELIANWDTLQTKQTPDGLIDPKSYYIGYADGKKAPQTKPLSDEEIIKIYNSIRSDKDMTWEEWCKEEIEFARAIEERHGIK